MIEINDRYTIDRVCSFTYTYDVCTFFLVMCKEIGGRDMTNIGQNKGWRIWWQLLRPHTLTASFVPVFIGSALAYADGEFHILLFLAMMIASILIQAATNMFNEYYDYKRGLDNEHSVGIGGTIVRDGISPKVILNLGIIFFVLAILLGLYISLLSSIWIAVIGAFSMFMGYLYTGGPYPIAYSPFGELFAGFFMGTVIILISYFIHTGEISSESIYISIPIMILVAAILTANNIRDHKGDKENGRKTLVILLGKEKAVIFLGIMFLVSYLWIIGMILLHASTIWYLLVFLSVPKAVQAIRIFRNNETPLQMMPAMAATAKTHTIFGFLVTIAIILEHLL